MTTPQIRFAGFDGEWSYQRGSSIFKAVAEKGFPHLPILSATQDRGMVPRTLLGKDIFYGEGQEVTYKRVTPGQFVVHLRSFQGGFAHSDYEGITSPAYMVFERRENSHHDDNFWGMYFKSAKFIVELEKVTYGIRDGKNISFEEFLDLQWSFPSKPEQSLISRFLKEFEDHMASEILKLKKLHNLKQSMLVKMFPQAGSTVPEIRFKGFDDEWSTKSLGSLCETLTDGDWIESKDQSESGIRLLQTGNVGAGKFVDKAGKYRWISTETFEKLNCIEIFPGDILVSRLPEPAGRACIVPNLGYRAITAVDCAIIRPSEMVSRDFLNSFLSTPKYFGEINIVLAGGTRQRVSRSNLANMTVSFPAPAEQEAIGNYFRNLDDLIHLEEDKLTKLKNLKNAFLTQMFV